MAHKGYLIVADITGYTAYLSTSELDHAQEILESLINTILKRIHPPMILSRTEGDAVFAYTLDDSFLQGQTMLEALEQIYCSFATELEQNRINTTCDCQACRNMPNLDLKLVIHFGEFGLQKLGNHTELIGSDVNLTHRLLKNHVIEQTGIAAYAFISEAAIRAMGLEEYAAQMVRHAETYDHLGTVHGYVYDLKGVYERDRQKRRLTIGPEQADITHSITLPIPPALVWDYINEPEFRSRFRFSESSQVSGRQKGRMAEGATYHCVHGDLLFYEKIVDWQPFEYVTIEGSHRTSGMDVVYYFTIYLEPIEEGTRLTVHLTPTRARRAAFAPLAALLWRTRLRPNFQHSVSGSYDYLQKLIAEEQNSGRLKMRAIAAQAVPA
ncbi:MAG: DUF2652 domain-containing protein [Chloroflexi bacterium]|nr:DUF2652 domain-containing protein [Chloroflexota bacterium]